MIKVVTISVAVVVLGALADSTDVSSAFIDAKLMATIIDKQKLDQLDVSYNGADLNLGNDFTQIDTSFKPTFDYNYQPEEYYALLMTDPDVPNEALPLLRELFHWIVGNIPGNRTSSGEDVVTYLPPLPPPVSGKHRYTFLCYRQSGQLDYSDSYISKLNVLKRPFSAARVFAKKYNLGNPIAGNFMLKGFSSNFVKSAVTLI